tara:strand:+ start:590 stop:1021 length:432 start_codon:yes stop_codon:yes gene_type:complete
MAKVPGGLKKFDARHTGSVAEQKAKKDFYFSNLHDKSISAQARYNAAVSIAAGQSSTFDVFKDSEGAVIDSNDFFTLPSFFGGGTFQAIHSSSAGMDDGDEFTFVGSGSNAKSPGWTFKVNKEKYGGIFLTSSIENIKRLGSR